MITNPTPNQEQPATRKARALVNHLQDLLQQQRTLEKQIKTTEQELRLALQRMDNEKQTAPWAEHWKHNLQT